MKHGVAMTIGLAIIALVCACSSPTNATYSVIYDGNGSTGGTVPVDSSTYASGATVTVLDNTGSLVKTGYIFSGWNTSADGKGTSYVKSSTFAISANTTLYAVWAASYMVTYDGNGATSGTAPTDSAAYISGATVKVLGNTGSLAKTDYAFSGWNTAKDGKGTAYAAGASFQIGSASVSLYAQWTPTTGIGAVSASTPSAITVTLTAPSSVSYGSAISASVATSASVDSYAWYLDSAVVSGKTGSSFSGGSSLAKGPHTLMVVVSKNSILYSASNGVTVQ